MIFIKLVFFKKNNKITTTTVYSYKNILINYLKTTIINKLLYKLQIPYYDRIVVFEGIDVDKTSELKECDLQPDVCNGYHDVLMISMNLSNIAILNINYVKYRWLINRISKSEAVNLPQKGYLTKKVEHYRI